MLNPFYTFLIGLVVASFGTMVSTSWAISHSNAIAAQQGLEQCPSGGPYRRGEIIWVKDCNDYLNSIKDHQ